MFQIHKYFLLATIFSAVDCFFTLNLTKTRFNFDESERFIDLSSVPDYWDWREHDAVTPVKNQLSCDACWAFSAIANIESQLIIHLKEYRILSEQMLIDCDPSDHGCQSGSVDKTFGYIINEIGGVVPESEYPYRQRKGRCNDQRKYTFFPVTGFKRINSGEVGIQYYVYNYGPVSVAINSKSMIKYKGNIDDPTIEECPPHDLNHQVLVVGYSAYIDPDTKEQTPYWIIKNSWGSKWGDKGYYYLIRGKNACGIESDPAIAFVN